MPHSNETINQATYSIHKFLLTIHGPVTVHLVNSQTLEGEFVAQDAYHIFIHVDDAPVMVPRQSILYIIGTPNQQIELDHSAERFGQEEMPSSLGEVSPKQTMMSREREITAPRPTTSKATIEQKQVPPVSIAKEEPPMSPAAPANISAASSDEIMDPSEMTTRLEIEYDDEPPTMIEEEEQDTDGTVVLPSTEIEPFLGDEPSTMIEEKEDDYEGTVVLKAEDQKELRQTDDFDSTVVLPETEIAEFSDSPGHDATVIIDDEDDDTPVPFMRKSPPPPPQLVCTSGPHAGQSFTLGPTTTIGRASTNAVPLVHDKEISRQHAIVSQQGQQYVIQDQNSLNGTFVNDQAAIGPHPLKNGDVILVGISHLEFRE